MMKKMFFLPLSITLLAISCPAQNENEATPFPGGAIRNIPAAALVRDMGIGVNIGNTFDSLNTGNIAGETGWGNPKVSRQYIRALKSRGYKSIRLPVSWVDYMGSAPDYEIRASWMNRVAEVAKWIIEEDMYCILNLHHDGGGDFDRQGNINSKYWIKQISIPEKEDETSRRFAAVWKQIALRFRDTGDKLILEAMNEMGFDNLWNRWGGTSGKSEAYRLLNKLNQTFVDAVRATGGNNTARFLLVSGYWTDIDQSCDPLFLMPDDTADDRLILSVHYYTPATFCILEQDELWGKNKIDWGNDETRVEDEAELSRQFNKLKTNFLDAGIPVILGEYGATKRNKAGDGRTRWMTAVTQICIDNGICPVLWDTGMRANNQGMADIRRTSPFDMSGELQAVWRNLRLP
ncbi:MAG: glycoside hydrolase family 5 protein [Treponema sp.]|jgi:endoglucanase|nr:glycoside hydrolase family 5 protein [Treponema sp.]